MPTATARATGDHDSSASQSEQAKRALYCEDCSEQIGQGDEFGLLSSGTKAKSMLDTARGIHRAYWAWYAKGPVRCALADRNGATVQNDVERERRQEAWLDDLLRIARRGGHLARVLFDQPVIDINPNSGPMWLDRLLSRDGNTEDWSRLSVALTALANCAGVQRVVAKCA